MTTSKTPAHLIQVLPGRPVVDSRPWRVECKYQFRLGVELTQLGSNCGVKIPPVLRNPIPKAQPELPAETLAEVSIDVAIGPGSGGIRIGRVETLCCKGGGKNGKHGAVTDHYNISAFSHLGVQVFELAHARQFRAYPQATSLLHTYQFRQLQPFAFLCRLSHAPSVNPSGIELTVEEASLFKDLSSAIGCFGAAVKLSRSRKKSAELDAEDVDTTEGF
ncbi:hypothetical protein B0H13DRAFT_2335353 [Mycena leptocephala]|nr:hypothetical protein B0H13DRAFT_2335353 [Mycena leptocephala]